MRSGAGVLGQNRSETGVDACFRLGWRLGGFVDLEIDNVYESAVVVDEVVGDGARSGSFEEPGVVIDVDVHELSAVFQNRGPNVRFVASTRHAPRAAQVDHCQGVWIGGNEIALVLAGGDELGDGDGIGGLAGSDAVRGNESDEEKEKAHGNLKCCLTLAKSLFFVNQNLGDFGF